jgi:tetratricopeptide (TPR) repeat protein
MANVTRKELLKEPDEFISTTSSIMKWIQENPRRFAAGLIVIIVILTSGFGLYFWKNYREQTAMSAYIKAGSDFKLVSEIAGAYTDTKAGKLAKLRLAGLAYAKGDTTDAIRNASEFIETWGAKDTLFFQSMLIMARAHMDRKEFAKALPSLDTCIASGQSFITQEAMYYKAMALKALGKNKEAVQILEDLLKQTDKTGASLELFQPEPTPYRALAGLALSNLNAETGVPLDAK